MSLLAGSAWRLSGWAIRVGLVAVLMATAIEITATDSAAAPGSPARRVLVISLPTASWESLAGRDLPNLDRFFEDAALGSVSVRGVGRRTTAGDGYLTMGAGTRARGLAVEEGQAFDVDEPVGTTTAGGIVSDRGDIPPFEGLVNLAMPDLIRLNEALPYDAELGSVGETLADGGWSRAVVANADGVGSTGQAVRVRTATLALADSGGVVPEGEVDSDLLVDDSLAAFGVRLDVDRVVAAAERSWRDNAVVLVEASDLARADAYRAANGADADARTDAAYRATDALVGRLLDLVDLERDAVLIVGPNHPVGQPQLTIAALRTPGREGGLLESATTRRAGIVTLADIGPTIVDLAGLDVPTSMEGTPFEAVAGGDSASRRASLVATDQAARFRDRVVAPVSEVVVLISLAVWVVAALAIGRWRGRTRLRRVATWGALWVLGVFPATYLAGPFAFHAYGVWWYWAFIASVAAALATAELLVGRRDRLDPLIGALGLIVVVLIVDVVTGARLQLNTVFGYSPIVGGRFAGLGNLAFGQLAGAGILLAGLLLRRFEGPRGRLGALAVLFLVLLVVGLPFWGADVGGALTMVVVVGVTTMLVLGKRVRGRTLVAWGATSVAVLAVFAIIDLSRPASDRTHLGRLVARIGDEGIGAFTTVVGRKLGANLSVLTGSIWTLMLPVAFGFLAWLIWRGPDFLRRVRFDLAEVLPGLALAAVLGFALNDSGIAVPGIMLGVVNAALAYFVLTEPVAHTAD